MLFELSFLHRTAGALHGVRTPLLPLTIEQCQVYPAAVTIPWSKFCTVARMPQVAVKDHGSIRRMRDDVCRLIVQFNAQSCALLDAIADVRFSRLRQGRGCLAPDCQAATLSD